MILTAASPAPAAAVPITTASPASSSAPPDSPTSPNSPATPVPAAPDVGPAEAPPGTRDACAEKLAALDASAKTLAPFLEAARCLRSAYPSGAGTRPVAAAEYAFGIDSAAAAAIGTLGAKAPSDRSRLLSGLQAAKAGGDPQRLGDMVFLAEAALLARPSNPSAAEASAWSEIAAGRLALQDPFGAGLAFLREAEADSARAGYARYRLEAALRTSAAETVPDALIDSLAAAYRHRTPQTAEMLETLAWGERAYRAAFRALEARMRLGRLDPGVVLDRVERFRNLGYADFAAAILDRLHWKALPPPWRAMARAASLRVRYQSGDWPGLLAEAGLAGSDVTGKVPDPPPGAEEACYVAAALLHLGRPEQAEAWLRKPAAHAPSPWGYQARLLSAQALIAQGRTREAARVLDALKRDPGRREGTGPILFRQACLALDEGRFPAADSLLVLASAYAGSAESQRALEYRFYLALDTAEAVRKTFFRGLPESPRGAGERARSLGSVAESSPLWPYARLEKAQIHLAAGQADSALALFESVARKSPARLAAFAAEARAAFVQESLPGGRKAALARYEDLLIKYQRGVIPEFSRGRIRALR